MAEVFRGSQIQPHGFLLIGGKSGYGRYWMFEPTPPANDEAKALPDIQANDVPGITKRPSAVRHVPVLERMLIDESPLIKAGVYPPYSSSEARFIAKKQSGVLLLDVGGRAKAFIPIQNAGVEVLREEGRLDSWQRSLSMANPDLAIIVNQGDLSAAAIHNLSGFLHKMHVTLMDVLDIDKKQVVSRRETAVDFSNKKGFMQGAPLSTVESASEPPQQHRPLNLALTAKQQILADSRILLDWFGLPNLEAWQQLDFEQKRGYHEQFAESFEAYLLDGKAPSA
jgi:hypothetical protein